jgi:hypothetical protein
MPTPPRRKKATAVQNPLETYLRDINETARKRFPVEGQGTSVAISLAGESANELPHTLRALTVSFITRRQAR